MRVLVLCAAAWAGALSVRAPTPEALADTVLVPVSAPFPVPTPQQLKYAGKISALIHFNMASFMHGT